MLTDRLPVRPVTAATVLLLRDGSTGPEVFLMRRALSMPFAPGMFVFPGGRLEQVDENGTADAAHPQVAQAAQRARLSAVDMAALMNCASREVREEAGIVLQPELLTLVGRWVTPEFEPRRYDVHFFAAKVGPEQLPYSASTETDEAHWYRPADCMEAFTEGRMPMLPPTLAMLAACAEQESTTDVLEQLGSRAVRPHLPRPLSQDGGLWCVVDAETQEVLIDRIRRPQVRETDAAPVSLDLP